ncbi:MAG: hypothetical protein ACFFDT_29080 [Candidatus Hodarchaeota archaeon]
MDICFLRILALLDSDGYFARTDYEKKIMRNLQTEGYVKLKKGTKKCYLITDIGVSHLNDLLSPNNDVSKEEFYETLKSTYFSLASPMNPLVRIPDIREAVKTKLKISNATFNSKTLSLHDSGEITLQTALAAPSAEDGIPANHGIFYYLLVE